METAESLGDRLAAELHLFTPEQAGAFLVGAIKADRAAVALAVLDELEELTQRLAELSPVVESGSTP